MRRVAIAAAAMVALVFGVLSPTSPAAEAVPAGASWNAGNIISDTQFYNGHAMTIGEVQAFLNSKVPVCDTYHAPAQGNNPPFTCLKDYAQSTPAMGATKYCGAIPASAGRSAAEIITVVGAACNLSQKAILVLLQKEQSLVTDTWPWVSQYNKATGFSCPDTAPCDPAYAGFFYQVYYAARMFQRYRFDPQDFNFRAGGTYGIQWHPNSSCGAAQVTITNAATAGLYNYTPYQPNSAAFVNMYGTGDACSSYGNRNFWRLWWDWFGDPHGGDPSFVKALYVDMLGRVPSDVEVAGMNGQLSNGRSRAWVADEFLYSIEFRQGRIEAAYLTVLGRPGEPDGIAYWLSVTQQGGLPIDQVEHYFLSSDEYYKSIGETPELFVTDLYRKVLARDPSAADVTYWGAVVSNVNRETALWSIYNSAESSYRRVDAIYVRFLGRNADNEGKNYWGPLVIGLSDNVVRSFIVVSDEYRTRAIARFPV